MKQSSYNSLLILILRLFILSIKSRLSKNLEINNQSFAICLYDYSQPNNWPLTPFNCSNCAISYFRNLNNDSDCYPQKDLVAYNQANNAIIPPTLSEGTSFGVLCWDYSDNNQIYLLQSISVLDLDGEFIGFALSGDKDNVWNITETLAVHPPSSLNQDLYIWGVVSCGGCHGVEQYQDILKISKSPCLMTDSLGQDITVYTFNYNP